PSKTQTQSIRSVEYLSFSEPHFVPGQQRQQHVLTPTAARASSISINPVSTAGTSAEAMHNPMQVLHMFCLYPQGNFR
ncbi:MAG: hypothetical protein Q8L91_14705, partial [Polaromonas sp.]|nr:hypothetical protein [Polaromonas sp.]